MTSYVFNTQFSFPNSPGLLLLDLPLLSSDGSPSPTTRFPHGASSLGLDCGSLASPTLSSLYSPGSSYGSLPVTPQARRLDVFLHYDPYDPRNTDHPSGARQPLRRFSGCLTHPDTIFPLDKHVQQFPLAGAEPSVVFLAREPIAAQSVTTVRYDGDRPNSADGRGSPPGGSNTSARSMSAPPTQVLRESYPLVCMQMPAVASPQSRSPYSSDDDADAYANMMNGRHHQEYFVYSTQLFNDGFWNGLRRENCKFPFFSNYNILIVNLIILFYFPILRYFLAISPPFVFSSPPYNAMCSPIRLREVHNHARFDLQPRLLGCTTRGDVPLDQLPFRSAPATRRDPGRVRFESWICLPTVVL